MNRKLLWPILTVSLWLVSLCAAARAPVSAGSWEAYQSKGIGQYKAGKRQDAEASFELALDASHQFARGDERAYTTYHDLAVVYEELGRIDEAVSILQQLLAKQVRELWSGHPDHLATLDHLEMICDRHGLLQEGLKLSCAHAQLERQMHGPAAWQAIETLRRQYSFLVRAGKTAQALPIQNELVDALAKMRRPGDPQLSQLRSQLALLYWNQQTPDALAKARPLLENVVANAKSSNPCQGPCGSLFAEYFYLGVIQRTQGHLDKAKQLLSQSLACAKQNGMSEMDPFISSILWHLAVCHRVEKNYEKALPLLKVAIVIMEKSSTINGGKPSREWLQYRSDMLKLMKEEWRLCVDKIKQEPGKKGE